MIETARLKQDLNAYKAMCREFVAAVDEEENRSGMLLVELSVARNKAVEMLDNERTVGK